MSHASHNSSQPRQGHDDVPEMNGTRISPSKTAFGAVLILLVFVALAVVGILSRMHSERVLADTTEVLSAPTVIALPPKPGAPVDTFTLPGNVTAYTDSPIYARTSGYLTRWYHDIGAHVKKGALLAEIASPEVDQQLAQAEADLATAEANASNAKVQANRYQGLVQSNAVSRQDTDTFVSQAEATAAAVKASQANVQRLKELQSFEKVYAPFDGVITARTVDTGQLIDAGAAKEMFHMQAVHTLRVYVNLPQVYAPQAKIGTKFDIAFPEHPGKTFTGTLVRTSDAIDPASRTLLVELDINNRTGELLPGSLAQVHFKVKTPAQTLVIPVAALIFRHEGLRVGTVVDGPKGSVAHLVPVVIGQDDGATVQIVNGLSSNDKVIQDPPDSLIEGERISPEKPDSGPKAEED